MYFLDPEMYFLDPDQNYIDNNYHIFWNLRFFIDPEITDLIQIPLKIEIF